MDKRGLRETIGSAHRNFELFAKEKLLPIFNRKSFSRTIRNTKHIAEFKFQSGFREKALDFWRQHTRKKIDLIWHRAYAATSGIEDVRYIPNDLWSLYILPSLNQTNLGRAYSDKNIYDRLFAGYNLPTTVLRKITNTYFDGTYQPLSFSEAEELVIENLRHKRLLLKPAIESGAGRRITVLDTSDIRRETVGPILKDFDGDFIIQEYLEQSKHMRLLNASSVNTIRIMTLRVGLNITFLSGIAKIGSAGNVVDHARVGGFACGFNKDGKLRKFALDKAYGKHFKHPHNGLVFGDFEIPDIEKVISFTLALHQHLPHFNIVGWDVALDKFDEPLLIEANLRSPGIGFLQAMALCLAILLNQCWGLHLEINITAIALL